jgi:hypothetical protein
VRNEHAAAAGTLDTPRLTAVPHSIISQIHVASGLGFEDHRIVTMRLYYWPVLHVDDELAEQDEAALEDFLHAPQNWTYDFGERWLPVQVAPLVPCYCRASSSLSR